MKYNNNDNNSSSNTIQIATLANGCFWCSEAIFKRLKGVKSVIPGYSGGIVKNPSYQQVCTGRTGHAESIQIEFDPKIIPYEKILDIFWYTHDLVCSIIILDTSDSASAVQQIMA